MNTDKSQPSSTASVRIALSQGATALIDAAETPWVTQWKCSARKNNRGIYYACRGERIQNVQKYVHLHRAIYERHYGPLADGLEIDHINRDPLDNRLCNLRAVTRSANNANRLHARQRKYDLPKGVFPRERRFIAQISIHKKTIISAPSRLWKKPTKRLRPLGIKPMSINSRQKGARAERVFRDLLRAEGYVKARRGQQFCGSPDSPDVVCPELDFIHWEIKAVERLNIEDAMAQARRDAKTKIPVVAHKRNFCRWLVTMDAETFFKFLRGDFLEPRMDTKEHEFSQPRENAENTEKNTSPRPSPQSGEGEEKIWASQQQRPTAENKT